jgi:deoxyribose-phosphate aldolase
MTHTMQETTSIIDDAKKAPLNQNLVGCMKGLIDLTYLGDDDDAAIDSLCAKADGVAALCVYAHYIPRVKANLAGKRIKIATVVNFPHGNSTLETVLAEMDTAISHGADEIDVVLPYPDFLNGDFHKVNHFLKQVHERAPHQVLKIIIESGVLQKPALIRLAGQMVIDSGADFIKTSTGKTEVGATLEAAYTLLTLIEQSKNPLVGLKLSGGIRTIAEAHTYLYLAREVMGEMWLNPHNLRIGASKLLDELLAEPKLIPDFS